MDTLQKLQLRQSQIRGKMSDLLELETRSDEQDTELGSLTREMRSLETSLQAAIITNPPIETETRAAGGDAESRERLELRGQFQVHRVFGALLGGSRVDGVEAEYATAVGATAGTIPTDVYETRSDALTLETRAVTSGVQGGTTQRPIVPAIFDRSIAPYLGIEMPSAGTGDQAFPILATSVTAEPAAKGATAVQTPGAFTVSSVQPRRLTGSFKFRVEDAARLAGMEGALRRNLREALSNSLDNHALNGSATGDGTINGLLNILGDPAVPAANAETWARYNAALAGHIDGLFAVDQLGVRALVGPQTYRHMASQFRATESNESFAAYAARVFGGVRATRRIANPSSEVQQAVIRRTNPAGDSVAVMPHWNSITIRDIYSGATEGEVVVTAIALVGDVTVLRSGAFVQDSFRVA